MEAQSAMLFRLNNHHGQKYNMVKSGSFGHQVNSDSDLVFFIILIFGKYNSKNWHMPISRF